MWEKCEKNSKKQVRNYLLRGRRELRKSEQWKKIKTAKMQILVETNIHKIFGFPHAKQKSKSINFNSVFFLKVYDNRVSQLHLCG